MVTAVDQRIEYLSSDEIREIQLNLLKRNLAFVKENSPFYKEKLKNINIEKIKELTDIRKFPFTAPEDLRKNPLSFLTIPLNETNYIFCSSGTTGIPKISFQEIPDEGIGRDEEFLDISENDIGAIINRWGNPSTFTTKARWENEGVKTILISMEADPKVVLKLLKELKVTLIKTVPSYILYLTHTAKKLNMNLKRNFRVRYIITGGYPLTKNLRNYVESEWDAKIFDRYGCMEMGGNVAYECKAHNGMHVHADRILFEVLDVNTGEPVKEGEVGEIVLTDLREKKKNNMSFIRYKVGDLIKFSTEKCKCGLTLPRIWVMGRRHESITVGIKGTRLFPNQIYEALDSFNEITGDFQLVLETENRLDILTFRVEVIKKEDLNNEDLKNKIKDKLENISPDLKDCISKRLLKLVVELVPPKSLPKTGARKPKDTIVDKGAFVR